MRKQIETLVWSSFSALWVVAVLSIPCIPETCIVCGERHGSNPAETLRNRSIIEWAFDDIPDIHFTCFPAYDPVVHNPDGGIR